MGPKETEMCLYDKGYYHSHKAAGYRTGEDLAKTNLIES